MAQTSCARPSVHSTESLLPMRLIVLLNHLILVVIDILVLVSSLDLGFF